MNHANGPLKPLFWRKWLSDKALRLVPTLSISFVFVGFSYTPLRHFPTRGHKTFGDKVLRRLCQCRILSSIQLSRFAPKKIAHLTYIRDRKSIRLSTSCGGFSVRRGAGSEGAGAAGGANLTSQPN